MGLHDKEGDADQHVEQQAAVAVLGEVQKPAKLFGWQGSDL